MRLTRRTLGWGALLALALLGLATLPVVWAMPTNPQVGTVPTRTPEPTPRTDTPVPPPTTQSPLPETPSPPPATQLPSTDVPDEVTATPTSSLPASGPTDTQASPDSTATVIPHDAIGPSQRLDDDLPLGYGDTVTSDDSGVIAVTRTATAVVSGAVHATPIPSEIQDVSEATPSPSSLDETGPEPGVRLLVPIVGGVVLLFIGAAILLGSRPK